MSLDLTPIKERLEKATKGPWFREHDGSFHVRAPDGDDYPWTVATVAMDCGHTAGEAPANAAFIANAPTDIAALVEEVERLRDALLSIQQMTDADAPDSYRSDDREGCLDGVYGLARSALTGSAG